MVLLAGGERSEGWLRGLAPAFALAERGAELFVTDRPAGGGAREFPSLEEVEWIIGHVLWIGASGRRADELRATAVALYQKALAALGRTGADTVVGTGSSRLEQRAVIAAARKAGATFLAAEAPIIPGRLYLTPGKAVYEVCPEECHWREWPADLDRARADRRAWLEAGITKHERVVARGECELPPGAEVFFGQVAGDAALWEPWATEAERTSAVHRARARGVVWKPHPMDTRRPFAGDPALPAELHVASVFAELRRVGGSVSTVSSGVGLEAVFAGIPVAAYGRPFWSQPEFVEDRSSRGEAPPSPDVGTGWLAASLAAVEALECSRSVSGDAGGTTEERLRFVDWHQHGFCVSPSDPRQLEERIALAREGGMP